METENFVAIDIQKEYARTLLAARVAATVFILLAAARFWLQYLGVGRGAEIFENMVTGGLASMPQLTKLVINHADSIAGVAALGGIGAIALVWTCGYSLSWVIYAGIAGVVCYLIIGAFFVFAIARQLTQMITQFAG